MYRQNDVILLPDGKENRGSSITKIEGVSCTKELIWELIAAQKDSETGGNDKRFFSRTRIGILSSQ